MDHHKRNREYFYYPTGSREQAGCSAFQRVLRTLYCGSLEKAVAAHLAENQTELTPEELTSLAKLIAQAKQKRD